MAKIIFTKGNDATIPRLRIGEPGWAIDTNTLYVGGSSGNQPIAGGGGGMTAHEMTGAYHTASGLSAGCVVRATGATTFAWQKLQHSDLDGVTSDQHHNRQHGLTDAADHSASGLSAGCVVRATGATTFAWQKLQHSDLDNVTPNQHHNQSHGITSASDHSVSGSAYDLVGLTSNSTLGVLKPTHHPDGTEAIMKSNSSGWIWPTRLAVGATSPVDHRAFSVSLDYNKLSTEPAGGFFNLTLNPSGSVSYSAPFGLLSGVYNDSAQDVGNATGIQSDVLNRSTGSMGVAAAVVGNISNDGLISSAIGLLASTIVNNNSMAAAYGVRIYDQDGATVNYGLHTGLGKNSLGDNLEFRQAATISTTAGQLTLDAAGGVVVNEDGDDEDFRVESDGNVNMLFVDAGNNRVGVGVAPSYTFHTAGQGYFTTNLGAGLVPVASRAIRGQVDTTTAGTTTIAGEFITTINSAQFGYGALFNPQVNRGATVHGSTVIGFETRPQILAGQTADVTGVLIGFIANIYHGGGGTLSTARAMQINNVALGGTVTTNQGLYISDMTAGTTNYAIYTNAGTVQFGDNVLIGTTAVPTGTEGKVLVFGQNGGDPTMAANTAGIYAKDILPGPVTEMFAIDENSNATQISPHDPITNEWIFYSVNQRTGKVLKIDMERLMRKLDSEFGGGFIHEYVE